MLLKKLFELLKSNNFRRIYGRVRFQACQGTFSQPEQDTGNTPLGPVTSFLPGAHIFSLGAEMLSKIFFVCVTVLDLCYNCMLPFWLYPDFGCYHFGLHSVTVIVVAVLVVAILVVTVLFCYRSDCYSIGLIS